MKASGHAAGKIILLGEHVVVYGAPALAAGIDRGARAEAILLPPGTPSHLTLGGATIVASPDAADDRARAFAALLRPLAPGGSSLPPVAVDAASELPRGGGLGSSAAIGVAIARAVLAAVHGLPDLGQGAPAGGTLDVGSDAEVLARALAWERVFHGNPSGIDTTAAAVGGCFRYTREGGARPIALARDVVLCVGSTGTSSSTKTMVEGVARLRARKPDLVDRSIAGISSLVENAALALGAGDLVGLGRLLDLNQMLLAGLMLSTEAIEQLCAAARGAGALGAKLTGAGGGGSVIALVGPDDPDEAAGRILAAWRAAGYQGFVTRIRKQGTA